jgi:hypothetical protein
MDGQHVQSPSEGKGSYGHGRFAWYAPGPNKTEFMSSGLTETFTYRGCEMNLKTVDLPEAQKSQELSSTCMMRFNLKDIDSTSIKLTDRSHLGDFPCTDYDDKERQSLNLNCDHTELSFSTRTGAGLIAEDWINVYPKLSGKDHENRHSDKSSSSYFEFDDPAYARRFAKAFGHAVELCGGRPSPF